MGNDGGSIPKRSELVKEAAKALTSAQIKEAQNEQQEYGWTSDPLTRKKLAAPVVSDAAGVLYNKDSIIEYLLKEDGDREKEEMGKVAGVKGTVEGGFAELGNFGDRVKGLKDVVEIKFETGSAGAGDSGDRWVCPITGKELGPGAKGVYIVPCGHAFAGTVVKEVAGSACLQCNEPYAENDVIPILPTLPTDIARLNLRIKTLREKGLTHALKKAPGSKKRKKGADKDGMNGVEETKHKKKSKSSSDDNEKAKPVLASTDSNGNGIKNASTASLTQKVMKEQEERNKRRKMAENANVKSLFNTSDHKPDLKKSADYMTRGFSYGKR
ncbi:Rtf2 RING-finger-domain-containing protein [Phaeosphaeria sp. MPI-PUGE-AT-0046c]|nr:Rtf2 RING-finger-domain-containing protein [Phaeosphaeria sp. MPI-PUGE-AT-0046c]